MTTLGRPGEGSQAAARNRPGPAGVLADRMAAALVHHEPGWRLPRLTALARRYSVGVGEVHAAIDALAARHLVRRLPDGQIYRASPAEYRVSLDGLSGLAAQVDPMGGQLACQSCQACWRGPPADIGRSLGMADGAQALAIRCLWTVGREPAAVATSFLSEGLAVSLGVAAAGPASQDGTPPAVDGGLGPGSVLCPWEPPPGVTARPRALQIELGLPPPAVARSLRLPPGEAAITVTVSLADTGAGAPLALTRAILRAELFRVVLETGTGDAAAGPGGTGDGAGFATAWTRVVEDWEP